MSPARKGKRSRKVAGRWQDRTNTDNGKRKEKRSTVTCRGRDNCCLSSIKKKSKRENLGKILRNGIRENVSYVLKRDTRSNNIKHKTRWHLASAAAKRRNRALPFYGFFFFPSGDCKSRRKSTYTDTHPFSGGLIPHQGPQKQRKAGT